MLLSNSFTLSKSDIAGTWKDQAQVSDLKSNNACSTYMVFNDDNTFVWGIDSSIDVICSAVSICFERGGKITGKDLIPGIVIFP